MCDVQRTKPKEHCLMCDDYLTSNPHRFIKGEDNNICANQLRLGKNCLWSDSDMGYQICDVCHALQYGPVEGTLECRKCSIRHCAVCQFQQVYGEQALEETCLYCIGRWKNSDGSCSNLLINPNQGIKWGGLKYENQFKCSHNYLFVKAVKEDNQQERNTVGTCVKVKHSECCNVPGCYECDQGQCTKCDDYNGYRISMEEFEVPPSDVAGRKELERQPRLRWEKEQVRRIAFAKEREKEEINGIK